MPVELWLLLVAEVASVTGFAAFPALLPELLDAWSLSPSAAGLVNGAFFAGYALASPILTALTDRYDARRIYLVCATLSCASQLSFAYFAHDASTASALRALLGVGVAGTFMPALSLLPEIDDPARKSRAISMYTASFGIGVSLSYVITALVHLRLSIEHTFAVVALGPLLSLAIVLFGLRPSRRKAGAPDVLTGLLRALRHPPAVRYGLAYAGHCAELFALRSWAVVLLAAKLGSLADSPLFAPFLAALTNAIGAPFNVAGTEGALRVGRRRWITCVLLICPLFAAALGLSFAAPAWLVVLAAFSYAAWIALDSGAITSGTFEAAPPELRGAVVALHTTLGFLGGFIGPILVGWVLDFSGGPRSMWAWVLSLACVSLSALVFGLPLIRRDEQVA